ncbi:hypothetical protein G5B40_11000 [Pikeienuella piscinae]|uniref:Uncharacterized protein n=1 Tax=Pikeienuella piscinae TaxID=2748098 RepID=A0A7L5BW33_9RHOB|nr:hypothetical protein [Pikeienuella piscinae]QIE55932.1 hypothetical protein G5B40_11000 [Pikeienuella piscinae]
MKLSALGTALIVSSILAGGCSTNRGAEEFGFYRETFQQTRSASDAILDRLAVTERRLWRNCVNVLEIDDPLDCEALVRGQTPFKPDQALYLVSAGDPPATAAFRRAIAAVGAYTEALNALASGQSADVVSGQVGRIVDIAAAAATAVAPPAAAGAGITAAISGVNAHVRAFRAPARGAIGFVARAEFRDQLLANGETMKAALKGVRDATPEIFAAFRGHAILTIGRGGDLEARADAIEETRVLLANWVILLDAADRALDAALAAAAGEGDGGVSGLIAAGQLLTMAAEETRRALAGGVE